MAAICLGLSVLAMPVKRRTSIISGLLNLPRDIVSAALYSVQRIIIYHCPVAMICLPIPTSASMTLYYTSRVTGYGYMPMKDGSLWRVYD